MLLLLSGEQSASPTTPTTTDEAGSQWGPWKPIRTRPLVTGSIRIRLPIPAVAITGDVLENEDWLLGLPTEHI